MARRREATRIKTVGDAILKLRLDRGWSINHLAKLSGVGRGAISGIERGTQHHQHETLARIAKAFGMEAAEIEAMVEPPPLRRTDLPYPPAVLAIAERIAQLGPFERAGIEMMLLIIEDLRKKHATGNPGAGDHDGDGADMTDHYRLLLSAHQRDAGRMP